MWTDVCVKFTSKVAADISTAEPFTKGNSGKQRIRVRNFENKNKKKKIKFLLFFWKGNLSLLTIIIKTATNDNDEFKKLILI